MKKEQLKIIKSAIDKLTALNSKFDSLVADAIGDLDKEIENLGNLNDQLQGEFDDLSETQQEGDKGTKLEELTEILGSIKDDLEATKDDLDDKPFEDIITRLEELDTEPK